MFLNTWLYNTISNGVFGPWVPSNDPGKLGQRIKTTNTHKTTDIFDRLQ